MQLVCAFGYGSIADGGDSSDITTGDDIIGVLWPIGPLVRCCRDTIFPYKEN